MHVSMVEHGSGLWYVRCPSHDTFVRAASAWGSFDYEKKAWLFSDDNLTKVKQLCLNCFGTDGNLQLPLVTVQMLLNPGCPFLQQPGKAILDGRIVARRVKAADTTVKLGWKVKLLEGGFGKSGSGRHGVVVLRPFKNTLLEVTAVPLHVATKLNRLQPAWLTICSVMDVGEPGDEVDLIELADVQRQRELLLSVSDQALLDELTRRHLIKQSGKSTKTSLSPSIERARRRMFGRMRTAESKARSELTVDLHIENELQLARAMDKGVVESQHELELGSLLLPKGKNSFAVKAKAASAYSKWVSNEPPSEPQSNKLEDSTLTFVQNLQKKLAEDAKLKKKKLNNSLAAIPTLFGDELKDVTLDDIEDDDEPDDELDD